MFQAPRSKKSMMASISLHPVGIAAGMALRIGRVIGWSDDSFILPWPHDPDRERCHPWPA
jgi:hypothetical protein